MIEKLRLIAAKHRLDMAALRELEELWEGSLPRVPTHRLDDGDRSAAPRMPLPSTPENFKHRYVYIRSIGRGGFSEVREVRDLHVGRLVALKEQLPERSSADDCTRFRREVDITARLQHPGVVPLYDWGELPDGRIWFTMKRIHGDTIGTRIVALHGLKGHEFVRALRRLLDDFRRLCEPVAYAHTQNVIHRDLTPDNLMIGDLGEVHVMDWGLSRELAGGAQATSTSSSESTSLPPDPAETIIRTRVAGTPFYMPPEQVRGDVRAMSPASDVYSLGAVLYEILSGQPPYVTRAGKNELPARILEQVLAGPPTSIEKVAPREVPKELYALCSRAMQRDPGERYADARALMEAVRDWLDGADRQERALRIVRDANREHLTRIEQLRADAAQRRARSREMLDRLREFDRAQDKAEGWKLADDAALIEQQAMREEIYWTQKLRSALNEAPDLQEAHTALVEHYATALLRAEADHDEPAVTRFAALLEDHTRKLLDDKLQARYEALLWGDGRLTIVTEPAGAEVIIKSYKPVSRYLMNDDERALTTTAPIHELLCERGSYLLMITAPGCRAVRYPVAIGRDEHWSCMRPGGASSYPVGLLREEELGPDDVYVPAGWFIAGGDPHAGESLPRRRIWVDGFVIRRHPVTNAEYVAFLNTLTAEGRVRDARRHCPRQHPGATMNDEAALAYLFDEGTGCYALMDAEAERMLPVVFVDWHAAMAYAAYWAHRTGLPWRLPSELEWEKAARGVDGRFMPWGDHVEPTWACVSGSHRERKRLMPVDTYPTDVSPYGVRGMAGNVRDWCIDRWSLEGPCVEDGLLRIEAAAADDNVYRSVRGGAWTSVGEMARLAIRYAEHPWKRHGVLGFRLARSLSS